MSDTDRAPVEEIPPLPEPEALAALWDDYQRQNSPSGTKLLELCYQQLRVIARRLLSRDSASVLLMPTELVNEAAMRIMRLDRMRFNDRVHFLATAAHVMRQVLLDEVRRSKASKRRVSKVTTSFLKDLAAPDALIDFEDMDEALKRLAEVAPDYARVVELRFFVGLTIEEIADVMGVSDSTVKRNWRAARAWLLDQLITS
jgi:RNA polymerase sigma factor (TIGR02999 family)